MLDLSFVPDLPTGPLDVYRNSASFDWKRLKLALEGDLNLLKLKVFILTFNSWGSNFKLSRNTNFTGSVKKISFLKLMYVAVTNF